MARKVRKIGELSTRQQPTNAPKWTVKQNTGQLDSTYLVNICSLTYVAKKFKPRQKLNHSQWISNGEPYSAKLSLHYSYSLFVFVVGCYGHCKGLHALHIDYNTTVLLNFCNNKQFLLLKKIFFNNVKIIRGCGS